MSRIPHIRFLLGILGLVVIGASILIYDASSPVSYPLDPVAVSYRGSGTEKISVQGFSGPVVMHVITGKGKALFRLVVSSGQKVEELVNGYGPNDEYRGYDFDPKDTYNLEIQGDQSWTVTVSPANPKFFSVLKVPGKFKGNGNAVIFLDGEYGVSTFQLSSHQNFTAWAYGPGGVEEPLYITPSGDYQGKSVLPIGARWIIVSTKGSWAVDVQAPCCKAPPGYK